MFVDLHSLHNSGICLLQSFALQLLLLLEKIFIVEQCLLTFDFQIQLHLGRFLDGLLSGHNIIVESEQLAHVRVEITKSKRN